MRCARDLYEFVTKLLAKQIGVQHNWQAASGPTELGCQPTYHPTKSICKATSEDQDETEERQGYELRNQEAPRLLQLWP
jgi:hypothetical protein